ncbi:MAG: PHP domain-containing protein [Gammaproteobacteria bacterium]|nr:MAG: PHP domain-containing protein [Gammaproteobacteria bacterium]
MKYDLHSHSIASDGTLTPTELVCRAKATGVTHLALSDHDTIAGLTEAQRAASDQGIHLITASELSAMWQGRTVHIVGLLLDTDCAELCNGIARQLAFRDWRGKEIARKLEQKAGIHDAYQGALTFVHGDLVSRSHFARYLVQAGYACDFPTAIKKYLLQGKPGHVKGDWAKLDEVISWIRSAGGIAVLAHPARYNMTATKMRNLLNDFVDAGGEAIEVISSCHTPSEVQTFTGHALRFDLLASAGSDFHGPENPWIELGRLADIPDACTPVWKSETWHQRIAA